MDKRHTKRKNIVQNLFAWSFYRKEDVFPHQKEREHTLEIIKNTKEIDRYIETSASRFSIQNISKIDLAILRLSIYELLIEKKNPYKVIIDEAVELGKELGAERSFSFINGVLGSVVKEIQKEKSP